jgi:hypothetical protein
MNRGVSGRRLVALTAVDIMSHRSGRAAGDSDGYQAARDERAADAWANTPEGQPAYGLAKAGSVRNLATCSGRGWTIKSTICYPTSESGSVYGWMIPARRRRTASAATCDRVAWRDTIEHCLFAVEVTVEPADGES